MFISDLFENTDHSSTPQKSAMNESDEVSDIIQAREYINKAVHNPQFKYEYFDFLKHIRNKHGVKYSTYIHQKASKLVKG